jgi:RNA polymerase sigma-70 factor (ECF subfamily)
MTTDRWHVDASTNNLAALGRELRLYFRGRVGNTRDAEDLVGTTWLAAGRTFQGRTQLRTYLYAIARRLVVEYYRVTKRRPWVLQREDPECLVAEVPTLESDLSDRGDADRLRRVVAEIPDPFREVIELAIRGYSHLEVAQMLGVNYNTVRSRFNRGKRHLKELLESDRVDELGKKIS